MQTAIRNALNAALAGHPLPDWTGFRSSRNANALVRAATRSAGRRRRPDARGAGRRASLGASKDLEERLFRAEMTDP